MAQVANGMAQEGHTAGLVKEARRWSFQPGFRFDAIDPQEYADER
jgi:hypothetical protein